MSSPSVLPPAQDATAASRLVTIVGGVVVIAGLYFGRQVLIPLALALVFAFLLAPVVGFLEKYRLGRVPSVLVVMALAFVLLAVVGWGVTNQLMGIVGHLGDYQANIHDKIESISSPASESFNKATATVNDLRKEFSSASEQAANKKLGRSSSREPIAVQVAAPPTNLKEYVRAVAGPLSGLLETAAAVAIFTLFLLVRREDFRNRLFRLAGNNQLNVMTQVLDDASRRLGRYLFLLFAVNAAYGALFGLGLYLIGVPNPLLWGVCGSLLRFIPYIGTPIAAAFPMIMAVAVFPGWMQAGLTFVLFLCLELTIANLIEPWLYGSNTGISSLAILVAAIFWGTLWGPVGLILSTPLTVCLLLAGRHVPQLSFLEILLGDEPVLAPQAHFYQRLLALDDEEARQITDRYSKDNSLAAVYDSVFIPALGLAEQDRHRKGLDEVRARFIYQTIWELVEEMFEAALRASPPKDDASVAALSGSWAPGAILCLPANDEADDLAGAMLTQLLQFAGRQCQCLPRSSLATMLEQVENLRAGAVCVSALPPFAAGHARSVCKQLRKRFPQLRIIVGLWGFPGGVAKAQERIGVTSADKIGTSLVEVVSILTEPASPKNGPPPAQINASEVAGTPAPELSGA